MKKKMAVSNKVHFKPDVIQRSSRLPCFKYGLLHHTKHVFPVIPIPSWKWIVTKNKICSVCAVYAHNLNITYISSACSFIDENSIQFHEGTVREENDKTCLSWQESYDKANNHYLQLWAEKKASQNAQCGPLGRWSRTASDYMEFHTCDVRTGIWGYTGLQPACSRKYRWWWSMRGQTSVYTFFVKLFSKLLLLDFYSYQ